MASCPTTVYADELGAPQFTSLYKFLELDWYDKSNPYINRYRRTALIWWCLLILVIITTAGLIYFFIKRDVCKDYKSPIAIAGANIFSLISIYLLSTTHYYPGKYRTIKKKIERYQDIEKCI